MAASVLTAACETAAPNGRDVRHSQVVIDLRQLALAGQQGGPITIIETVTLTITPANGTEQQLSRAVSSAASPVTFDVTVETGIASFAATVLSNNGTALYSAEADADIQEDGFSVALQLAALSPVLMVSPDSLQLGTEGVHFTVTNIGLDSLAWELVPDGGLEVSPSSGQLGADSSQDVLVFGGPPPGEAVLVRFLSPEGELEAKVQGVPQVFAVAVTPDGAGAQRPEGGGIDTVNFIVRNIGNVTDTYSITCSADNFTCTEPSLPPVQVDAGDSAQVAAGYNADADGTLVLRAASPNAGDDGSYVITCCLVGLHREE